MTLNGKYRASIVHEKISTRSGMDMRYEDYEDGEVEAEFITSVLNFS